NNGAYHLDHRDSRVGRMLISKLLQTRKADAELPKEIRAALIESLFAPIASLLVGAVACSIIGAAVALRVGDKWIMGNSLAILAVGMLRVASALFYKRYKEADKLAATRAWERVYEYGAWGFAALLGLLCWMTLSRTTDASLQMAVTTITAGYAAAISGRNAGRPFIAVRQLALCTLPISVALLSYPHLVHQALGLCLMSLFFAV